MEPVISVPVPFFNLVQRLPCLCGREELENFLQIALGFAIPVGKHVRQSVAVMGILHSGGRYDFLIILFQRFLLLFGLQIVIVAQKMFA